MTTSKSTIDFILDQLGGDGIISAKKMFGEYSLYYDHKVVALVCDDELFIKPTTEGKTFIGDYEEKIPYPGGKPYLLISGDLWEKGDWLLELIRLTADALPKAVRR